MDLQEYFEQTIAYNYWATRRLRAAAATLSETARHGPQGQSWGSLHDTFLHMMNAEWIWLKRWLGESPEKFFQTEDFPTFAALNAFWEELEVEMRAFIANQTPADLEREVTYTSTLGQTYRLALWQMLAQIVNHGTQHRTEIAALLTKLDVPHPENDFVYYIMETTGQRPAPEIR